MYLTIILNKFVYYTQNKSDILLLVVCAGKKKCANKILIKKNSENVHDKNRQLVQKITIHKVTLRQKKDTKTIDNNYQCIFDFIY